MKSTSNDMQSTLKLLSQSPEETRLIGNTISAHAKSGDIILLTGDLGAGKTCLTQGLLLGLGSNETARSPTFVIATEYVARIRLYHLDLYRLDHLEEIEDLGLDEYLFGEGICVVEWAEKGDGLWPNDHLTIRMDQVASKTRLLTLLANGNRHCALLDAIGGTVPDMTTVAK